MQDRMDTVMSDPESDRRRLIEHLSANPERCPLCNYNLYGLTSDRCPECGKHLKLQVGLTEAFLKAWLVLVAPLLAGSGLGVFFWVLAPGGFPGAPDFLTNLAFHATIYYFMAMPLVAFFALFGRRRFLRLSKLIQWRVAMTAATLTAIAFLVFLGFVL